MAEIPSKDREYQLAHIHESRAGEILSFWIVWMVVTTICVVARLASRKYAGMAWKADDITIVIALILLYGVDITYFLDISKGGLGRHALANSAWQTSYSQRVHWASNLFYTTTWPMTKISILLLYHRIFATRRFRQVVWVFIGILIIYISSTVIVDIFTCRPIRGAWDKTIDSKCINQLLLYEATAGANVGLDLCILLLPNFVVWNLSISTKKKLGVSAIFCLGFLTVIMSIMRIVTDFQANNNDIPYTLIPADMWTGAELHLSVICACLPTIMPVLRIAVSGYKSLANSYGSSRTPFTKKTSFESDNQASTAAMSRRHDSEARAPRHVVTDEKSSAPHLRPESGNLGVETDAYRNQSLRDRGDVETGMTADSIHVKQNIEWTQKERMS